MSNKQKKQEVGSGNSLSGAFTRLFSILLQSEQNNPTRNKNCYEISIQKLNAAQRLRNSAGHTGRRSKPDSHKSSESIRQNTSEAQRSSDQTGP